MSVADTTLDGLARGADKAAFRLRLITLGTIAVLAVYYVASFVQFDIASIAARWSPERASLFLLDTYAYRNQVEMRWDRPGVTAMFDGNRRAIYQTPPDWLDVAGDDAVMHFDNGGRVEFYPDRVVLAAWPKTDRDYTFRVSPEGRPFVEGFENGEPGLPGFIRVTANKVEVRPSLYERVQVYKSKVEVHRFQLGWGHFWFDFDSPLSDVGFVGAIKLMLSGDEVVPGTSNTDLVIREFLDNEFWLHGLVLFALLETLLMALIGTMIACLVGFPLAFLAARNVTPFGPLRFILRRLFDILRGVDMLVWSLILLRAFGPGLFSGIFAIGLTDIGTMGKLMSEAIENADSKQREGVASTGATAIQQHRFGIVPQILPVFISQSLYYLESNTRGAVIIGAMGAGGIGLQFLGALQTGTDFENVAYIALLVLLLVIAMDTLSSWLRRALIGERR